MHALVHSEGIIDLSSGGVHLHINVEDESSWVEFDSGFSPAALASVERIVTSLGFEFMDEYEGIEELEGNRYRHWLAQTDFGEEMGVSLAS